MRSRGRERERVLPTAQLLAVARGRRVSEHLVQQRGDGPVDPVLVRPTVRPDEEMVDVLSHVQQQEVRGSLRIEPLAQRRLGAEAMFEVKRESDRTRLAAVLDLSTRSFSVAIWALLGAVLLGVAAMLMGNHGGRLWVWVSIVVLTAVMVPMTPLADGCMNRVRRALGLRSERNGTGRDPTREALSDDELRAARAALRPGLVALVGLAGALGLVWLMEAKPF